MLTKTWTSMLGLSALVAASAHDPNRRNLVAEVEGQVGELLSATASVCVGGLIFDALYGECVAPSSSVAVATSPAITVTVTDWQTKMVTKYKQGSTTTIHDCATPTAKQTHHHGHHHSKEKKPKKEKPTFPHTSETTSDELTEVATQVQATSSWVAVPSPETTAPSTVRAPETAAGTTAWQPAVSSYVAQDEPWSEPAPSPEPSQANTGCAHDKCCDCKEPDADENCPDGWSMDALLRLCVKIDLHPEADEGIISADLGLGRENGKLLDPTAPLVDVEGVVEGATEPILSVAFGGEDHKVLGGIL